MKLTAAQLMQKIPHLNVLSNTKISEGKSEYRITKALNKIQGIQRRLISEARSVYQTFGELSEDGKIFQRPADPEKAAKFDEELGKIDSQEIELDLHLVDIKDLGNIAIEPVHLLALNGFILTGIDDEPDAPMLTLIDGGKTE